MIGRISSAHVPRTVIGTGSECRGGLVLLGLGVIVLGFVGVFFGNLIKAAVSRQREFLADASAVQFTAIRTASPGPSRRSAGWPKGRASTTPRPPRPATCSSATLAGHARRIAGHPSAARRAHPPDRSPVRRPLPGGAAGRCRSRRTRRPPPQQRPAVRRGAEVTGAAPGAGLGVRRGNGVPGRPRRSGSN